MLESWTRLKKFLKRGHLVLGQCLSMKSQIIGYTCRAKSKYFGRKNQDGGGVWVFLKICQERNLRSDEVEHNNDNRRVNLIDNAFT
jgi:hypothetical protein